MILENFFVKIIQIMRKTFRKGSIWLIYEFNFFFCAATPWTLRLKPWFQSCGRSCMDIIIVLIHPAVIVA